MYHLSGLPDTKFHRQDTRKWNPLNKRLHVTHAPQLPGLMQIKPQLWNSILQETATLTSWAALVLHT